MSGLLTLSDRGGANPVTIPHAGAALSWALSTAGSFSAIVPSSIARRFDFAGGNSAGRYWLRYEHPCLPDWGGVVTMPAWSEGALELGAEGFESLLRKRRVPRVYGQQSATPGALFMRAFRDVQADDYIGIVSAEADEIGDPLSWEWRGGDLYDDIARQLSQSSGQDWNVDADRNLRWLRRAGSDKTGSVMLYHPHEITSYSYVTDLWTTENDIEGVAADARYDRSVNAIRDHDDSVRAIGRYMVSRRYDRVVKGGTLVRKIWNDINRNAWPSETMELTTVNVGQSWSAYHVGDSVGVTLPDANAVRQVRILARSIDVDAGLETLGVDVEFEADGW